MQTSPIARPLLFYYNARIHPFRCAGRIRNERETSPALLCSSVHRLYMALPSSPSPKPYHRRLHCTSPSHAPDLPAAMLRHVQAWGTASSTISWPPRPRAAHMLTHDAADRRHRQEALGPGAEGLWPRLLLRLRCPTADDGGGTSHVSCYNGIYFKCLSSF